MAFSGISTNKLFTPSLIGEDVSDIIRTLSPYEAPFLDWLGDSDQFATSTKHEFVQDYLRPRYIINSTAINSLDTTSVFQVNGLGESLTVGTILENESAAPELMQINSILGANSVSVARNYDGSGVGSLAAGGSIFVRWPAAEEGHEHSGANAQRLGLRTANTVGYFSIEISATNTALAVAQFGNDNYANARAKVFQEIPGLLESEVIRGALNATNSLGTTSASRTMKGIRGHLTAVNSTVAANSFAANPHRWIGDVHEQVYQAGAATTESWGIVAGRTFFRNISDLNDSKVQDSNAREVFKRVIRNYEGPFGQCTVFLSRALPATELLLLPKERIKVLPLQGRNFSYLEMGVSGDNVKGMVVGEYTVEVHHGSAMGRLRV